MITRRILNLAVVVMPAHRKDWGAAMLRELDAADPGLNALTFAIGCLWASCAERISVMKLIVSVGRWGVGLVAMLYGASFLRGAWLFASIQYAHAPDRYRDMLLANHHIEEAAQRVQDYPWLMVFCGLMALSHVAAGVCLIGWRPKPFILACAAAAATPIVLVSPRLPAPSVMPLAYLWPLLPLALLVAAAVFLAWLDSGKPRNMAAA